MRIAVTLDQQMWNLRKAPTLFADEGTGGWRVWRVYRTALDSARGWYNSWLFMESYPSQSHPTRLNWRYRPFCAFAGRPSRASVDSLFIASWWACLTDAIPFFSALASIACLSKESWARSFHIVQIHFCRNLWIRLKTCLSVSAA